MIPSNFQGNPRGKQPKNNGMVKKQTKKNKSLSLSILSCKIGNEMMDHSFIAKIFKSLLALL